MDEAGRVRIKFVLEDDPSGVDVEWMWAMPLGGKEFRLENTPLHAYGLSYLDVISATVVDDVFQFSRVVLKSGHRTVRMRFPRHASHEDFKGIWAPFESLGCTYEGSQEGRLLYALDVPANVDLKVVVSLLEDLEGRQLLEYEEADCF